MVAGEDGWSRGWLEERLVGCEDGRMRGWLEEGWKRKGIKIKRRLKKENKFIFIFISLKCQWWK